MNLYLFLKKCNMEYKKIIDEILTEKFTDTEKLCRDKY